MMEDCETCRYWQRNGRFKRDGKRWARCFTLKRALAIPPQYLLLTPDDFGCNQHRENQ